MFKVTSREIIPFEQQNSPRILPLPPHEVDNQSSTGRRRANSAAERIPLEVLREMAEYCDYQTICKISQCSRFFLKVGERASVWENFCLKSFAVIPSQIITTNQTTPKELFVLLHKQLRQTLKSSTRCRSFFVQQPQPLKENPLLLSATRAPSS